MSSAIDAGRIVPTRPHPYSRRAHLLKRAKAKQVLLMRLLGAEAGVEFLDRVRADARHEVVWCDSELGQAAVDRWLRPFRGERFSLCGAVSFEVMDRRRISWALALDRHFKVAGYGVVPVDNGGTGRDTAG